MKKMDTIFYFSLDPSDEKIYKLNNKFPIRISRKGPLEMAFEVAVNKEKCTGCEECIEVCTVQVLEMQGGKCAPIHVKECIGCRSCVEVCEEKAVTVEDLEVEISETARLLLKDIL
jgi:NAD-dependent dihydropyrimidine dehydrogenase PreA subunit